MTIAPNPGLRATRLPPRRLPLDAPEGDFVIRPCPRRANPALLAAAVLTLAACAAPVGAPAGAPSPATGGPAIAADTSARRYTASDVQFVQHMLAHHAQALVMTELVPTHTTRDDLRMLARRIDVSQQDEIATMQRWLRTRGADVPSMDAQHAMAGHHAMMPGLLTEAELDRLAAARGAAFDRLFLEFMIRHHEGALIMVTELFAARGSAQEPELFSLASDIDADQRADIMRMRRLLDAMTPS